MVEKLTDVELDLAIRLCLAAATMDAANDLEAIDKGQAREELCELLREFKRRTRDAQRSL